MKKNILLRRELRNKGGFLQIIKNIMENSENEKSIEDITKEVYKTLFLNKIENEKLQEVMILKIKSLFNRKIINFLSKNNVLIKRTSEETYLGINKTKKELF